MASSLINKCVASIVNSVNYWSNVFILCSFFQPQKISRKPEKILFANFAKTFVWVRKATDQNNKLRLNSNCTKDLCIPMHFMRITKSRHMVFRSTSKFMKVNFRKFVHGIYDMFDQRIICFVGKIPSSIQLQSVED
jgi:hypothetical protein